MNQWKYPILLTVKKPTVLYIDNLRRYFFFHIRAGSIRNQQKFQYQFLKGYRHIFSMLIQAFLCLVVAVGRFVLGSSLVFRPIFSLLILWQCFSFVDEPDMGENGKLNKQRKQYRFFTSVWLLHLLQHPSFLPAQTSGDLYKKSAS